MAIERRRVLGVGELPGHVNLEVVDGLEARAIGTIICQVNE